MKNPLTLFGAQSVAKAVTLVVVIAGAATVAVTNLPQPVDHTLAHLPARDAASWALPLDRYTIGDFAKRDYAEDLLVGKCLAAEGIDWGVPWQNVENFAADREERSTAPLSARGDLARGYHAPAVDDYSTYLWHRFFEQVPLSAADEGVSNVCSKQVRKTELPLGPVFGAANQEASTRAGELADRARDAALRDRAVVEAAAGWRSCLASAYASALSTPATVTNAPTPEVPVSPAEMPTTGVRQTFATEVVSSPVTAAEKALANKDAACQVSSGYRSALYEAEYRLQSKVTATDAKVFARATADQPAFDRKLDAIIRENLPAKPAE